METAALAIPAAILAMTFGLPVAILASRIHMPGSNLLGFLMPLPLFLPPLMIAQAWHGMTGMDGRLATIFVFGAAFAPLPALLATRSLQRQSSAAHESALLAGGPWQAIREMLCVARPATLLGGALTFLLVAGDFAVPDYFGTVGPGFGVYAAEIFNAWRDWNTNDSPLGGGLSTSAPLILLTGIVLYFALRNPLGRGVQGETGRPPTKLMLGKATIPLTFCAAALGACLLILPLGRILWETGAAGPLAEGDWISRSWISFSDALQRGRMDILRSIFTGLIAGGFVLVVAPALAHLVVSCRPGRLTRALLALTALPLLVPGVATGLGAIHAFHRPGWENFYESPLLPGLVLGGRFLPIAIFLLAERMMRSPRSIEEAGHLAGLSYPVRLYRCCLSSDKAALFLAAGIVAVFSFRELDLAVLLPAANASAAVRYYNALHFARDSFVAAFGLLIALILFVPIALSKASSLLSRSSQS